MIDNGAPALVVEPDHFGGSYLGVVVDRVVQIQPDRREVLMGALDKHFAEIEQHGIGGAPRGFARIEAGHQRFQDQRFPVAQTFSFHLGRTASKVIGKLLLNDDVSHARAAAVEGALSARTRFDP